VKGVSAEIIFSEDKKWTGISGISNMIILILTYKGITKDKMH